MILSEIKKKKNEINIIVSVYNTVEWKKRKEKKRIDGKREIDNIIVRKGREVEVGWRTCENMKDK